MNRQQRRKLQRIQKRNEKKQRIEEATFNITEIDESNIEFVLDKIFNRSTVCERIQDAEEKGITFSQQEIDLMHEFQAEIDSENELQLKKMMKMMDEDKKCP
tara:strand:- start:213 stop:518 length:306 start_codon:yes stop_codon:yes gene_type:complete